MTNPRLASRYAKSLMGLAQEQQQLEAVYADMEYMRAVCNSNKDFVNLLRSPVIKANTKQKIVGAITEGKIGVLTTAFNNLIIHKGRESNLPEIAATFIQQYKDFKGVKTVKITTAVAMDNNTKQQVIAAMKQDTGATIEIESVVDEGIIGGFVLQTGDNLVDASIAYDLRAIKKQFMNNDFIYKIR